MSFVDARVIQQRMDQKDARMAKKLKAKVRKSSTETQAKGAKIGEAEDVSSIPASNRNEQPSEEVPTLAIPNSTATTPVRTDNPVAPTPRTIAEEYGCGSHEQPAIHVMSDGEGVEVWLNPDETPDTGLCLGSAPTRHEAVQQAVEALEWALTTLQTIPAPHPNTEGGERG